MAPATTSGAFGATQMASTTVDHPVLDHFGLLARIAVGRSIIDQFNAQFASCFFRPFEAGTEVADSLDLWQQGNSEFLAVCRVTLHSRRRFFRLRSSCSLRSRKGKVVQQNMLTRNRRFDSWLIPGECFVTFNCSLVSPLSQHHLASQNCDNQQIPDHDRSQFVRAPVTTDEQFCFMDQKQTQCRAENTAAAAVDTCSAEYHCCYHIQLEAFSTSALAVSNRAT